MNELSRRQLLKRGAAFAVLATSGAVLAACGAKATSAPASGSAAPASAAPGKETALERIKRLGVIRAGFTNEPPFSIAQGNTISGIDPEIFRAFLKTQGVETEDGVLMEFGSLIPALLASRIDAITAGLWMNPDRCKQILFSDPTTQIGQAFAVKKGNPFNLKTYKDVANSKAKLGANTGGLEFGWMDAAGIPKDQQVQFPDFQTSIEALKAGRVDAISNNTLAVKDYLDKLGDPNLEYVALTEQPVDASGKSGLAYSSFGFRKEDQDLVDAFNAWIKQAKQSGELEKIVTSFGAPKEAVAPIDATAAKICAGG
jgi:polar amino acid transport system substrate-binding protein